MAEYFKVHPRFEVGDRVRLRSRFNNGADETNFIGPLRVDELRFDSKGSIFYVVRINGKPYSYRGTMLEPYTFIDEYKDMLKHMRGEKE
jgi:hypothetical protein